MSSQQQAEKTAEQHFQDGLAFSKLGDDRRTFESYKKAIELDPDYFLAHFNTRRLGFREYPLSSVRREYPQGVRRQCHAPLRPVICISALIWDHLLFLLQYRTRALLPARCLG